AAAGRRSLRVARPARRRRRSAEEPAAAVDKTPPGATRGGGFARLTDRAGCHRVKWHRGPAWTGSPTGGGRSHAGLPTVLPADPGGHLCERSPAEPPGQEVLLVPFTVQSSQHETAD